MSDEASSFDYLRYGWIDGSLAVTGERDLIRAFLARLSELDGVSLMAIQEYEPGNIREGWIKVSATLSMPFKDVKNFKRG